MKSLKMKTSTIAKDINKAIKSVIRKKGIVPLHEPVFKKEEFKLVNNCLKTTMVSTSGKYVNEFENKIKKFTKTKYAVAVTSGTTGLYLSLKLLNINYKTEVLVPALTFVATANAVAHCGGIPHFVDVHKDTYGIDASKLRKYLKSNTVIKNNQCINNKTNRVIKAIIPVHVFGHMTEMDGIISIAKEFKLSIVEDATEALGSYYKNKHAGTFGKFGVLSFNGNKIITTGGGGMILTNNKRLAIRAKHLSTTAKKSHKYKYIHDEVGYNFRLPNINAALGIAQINRISGILKTKRNLYLRYKKSFSKIPFVKIKDQPENSKSNFWLNTIYLDKKVFSQRNKIIEYLIRSGICARPAWELLPDLKPFRNNPKMDLKNSKEIIRSIINIPSSYNL